MAVGTLSLVTLGSDSDMVVTNSVNIDAAPTGAAADNLYLITNTSNSAIYVLVNISGAYTNASIYNHGDHNHGGIHRSFVDSLVPSASGSGNVTEGWIQPQQTVVLRATLTSGGSRVRLGANTIRVRHNAYSAIGDRVFVDTGGVHA